MGRSVKVFAKKEKIRQRSENLSFLLLHGKAIKRVDLSWYSEINALREFTCKASATFDTKKNESSSSIIGESLN